MKTKERLGILLLFLITMGFISCGDDNEKKKETYPLSFEKEYYEVPLLGKQWISIRGGNRDYSITVEKTDILEASVDLSSPTGMGNLVIQPKQKGETTVTVKDNIVNETVKLKIKVTDGYLAYAIDESNHPALSKGVIIYLINNEAKDCYFFRYIDSKNELSNTPITKGTYDFFIKLESGSGNSSPQYAIPYLTLNYTSDEQGKFTDAAIPPTPHHLRFELYDGITNADAVLALIETCLGIDWKELVKKVLTKSDMRLPSLKTTIDNTDYVIIGTVNTMPKIPENILE